MRIRARRATMEKKASSCKLRQMVISPEIIYVVEFKVCCDSSPEQTYQRAFDQHDNLRSAISLQAAPDAVVHTLVILVGVAGMHGIRKLHPPSAPQTRHQRQPSEVSNSEASNLRHATHAKDLVTPTETPASGQISSNHESRALGSSILAHLHVL